MVKFFLLTGLFIVPIFAMDNHKSLGVNSEMMQSIRENGFFWYLLQKISWNDDKEEKKMPHFLCFYLVKFIESPLPLPKSLSAWLYGILKKIEIPFQKLNLEGDYSCLEIINPMNLEQKAYELSGKNIGIWDGERGKEIVQFKGHAGPVFDIAYDLHDQTRLASCSQDGTIRIWNISNPNESIILESDAAPVYKIAFDPHKRNRLISSSQGKTISAWDVIKKKNIFNLEVQDAFCSTICLHPFYKNVLVGGTNKKMIYIWDTLHKKVFAEFNCNVDLNGNFSLFYRHNDPHKLVAKTVGSTNAVEYDLADLYRAHGLLRHVSSAQISQLEKIHDSVKQNTVHELSLQDKIFAQRLRLPIAGLEKIENHENVN